MLKKGDYIIFLSIAFLGVALLFFNFFGKQTGKTVIITEKGETVYEGSLSDDKTVTLSGNTVVIENGCAYIESANCKNQVCVNTGEISEKGETIVCTPNRVVVEVE
ncbi:MAG: NusG domain II-containing protein [Clostridia bacterium]|nr:NusG domain II-containing protein [Clostridia bacterium]